MYDISTRKRALALLEQGRSLNSVSRETGISRATIRSWQDRLEPLPSITTPAPGPPADDQAYAYRLGLCLGDGCVSAHPRGTGTTSGSRAPTHGPGSSNCAARP